MSGELLQQAGAIVISVGAGLYVVKRLTGWPRRRKPRDRDLVKPSGRLARGLDRARREKT